MIRHTHNPHNENCVWHDGSLADCPDSTYTEVALDDGRKARFYHGLSMTPPPATSKRLRLIDDIRIIE